MGEEHCRQETFKQGSVLLVLIVVVLLIPTVSASTFINIFVDETGEAIFLGETDGNPVLPSGIELKNNEIVGLTSVLTNKMGDTWTFSYSLPDSEFVVALPKGAVIKGPVNGEISIENDRILVYAIDEVTVNYNVEKQQPQQDRLNVPLLLALLGALIVLVVFVINYSKRDKKETEEKPKQKKLDLIKQVLSDREKLILDKLHETGKVKSSHLRKLCDIPKASFSRHTQELEKKNLIKRTGEGRNKFVELAEK